MKLLATISASKQGTPRRFSSRILCVAVLLAALLPAVISAQTLEIDLLRMSEMLDVRYYIAEKGMLPPWLVLLGGVSNTGDSVGAFLYPNPLEIRFDLRDERVEFDEGTGLIFRFRVPKQYDFSRKQERRDLFYCYTPRDFSIPGLEIGIERIDDRADAIWAVSSKKIWIEDVRYNLAKDRAEMKAKGLLSLDLPIALPKPIERIIGKGQETNLIVQGSERIAVSGKSNWCSNCPKTEATVSQSKFPDLDMEQELNVSLHGTVGEKIHVEVQHSSAGSGTTSTNRVRINYRGFDDDVIKLIEMGDTDLSLSGAQLVSYSGSAEGLFGVKVLAAMGPLDLTFIASKEEGETASGSYTAAGGAYSAITISDYDFIERQFFFFENPGKDFQNPTEGFRDVYPVVGADASGSDEIEVFVSLKPAEYSDATIFKYGAKAYADTLNNGLEDDMASKPFRGLVKQIFLEEGDFTLIQDYSSEGEAERYIGIQLASPLDESRALMVRYKARHMASGPNQGEEFLVGDYSREPESETDSLVAEIICYPKDATTGVRATDPTWNMMMRNVYSLGTSQIDLNSLKVRIEDTSNEDNNYLESVSGLSYLRIFGLDRVVNSTGLKGKDDLIDNTPGVLDLEQGYLMFSWYEPFNPPEAVVKFFLSDETDTAETNFDYARLDLCADLYSSALTNNVKNANHYYNIIVESSSGQRVFQLSSYDIIEGSDVVTVDGTKLSRGSDYDIDYSSGIVTLKTSILPDSKINIDYQHSSLVSGGRTSLLGLGANLNLSQNFRLNGTFLYSSVGAPKYTPRLGEEPTRMMATDLNGSFIFYPKWMTTVANLLPRVDTENTSSLNIGGEIAVSLPNPNVKGKAIVDDMEGTEEADQVDFLRRSWNEASPAYDTLGIRHGPASEAQFSWYNAARTAKQEYFVTSKRDLNPALDERENSTVTTLFLDVNEPEIGQWCGIMTGFSGGGLDLSTAQYLEIWVNDFDTTAAYRGGTVHIDFGRVDEDFYRPDSNEFDNEDQMPYGWIIDEDTGFEGESCTYPSDFGDSYWDESHYVYRGINCRRGNGMLDSEDLNDNGYLDEINAFYTVSFNLADSADIDIQRDYSKHDYSDYWNDPDKQLNPRKAWRKYRIDLSKAKTVFGEPRIDAVQHIRIWLEGVDSLMTFNDSRLIEFAELQFVGSRWEFNGIRNLADSLDSSGAAPGQRLIVGTINNKDDASHYEPPYQVQQEEGIDNKEGSLRLDFEDFAGWTSFRVLKRFYGTGQDYGQYRDLEFFVRSNYNVADVDDVEFYLQIAYDSTNYYEIEIPFTSDLSKQWLGVKINLSDLTNLKLEADELDEDVVTKEIYDKISGRAYNATLMGNPTLFNVRFLYIGLRNRAGHTVDAGEVWFNDIRLDGVRKDIDHAENARFSADFAGILQLNGSMTRRGPEFRSLRQTNGSGSTSSGYNLGAKTSVNYFLPTGGFNLPITLQYNSSSTLPKYKLKSDVEIMDASIRKSLESVSTSYGFSVAMSRRGSSNYLMRNLFDNMKTSFSYAKRGSRTPTTRDTTVTMSGNLSYQLEFRAKRELTVFRGIKWRYWLSSLSYETSANRQTKQGYTLSGDTIFVKRPFNYGANWQNAVHTRYEPFESVKINFSLSERRDLGVDHDFFGVPIGTETTFGHNLSLNFQPNDKTFILSEFNPRFDFKSNYSEDLSTSNRQVRSTYYDTTYVTTCDSATNECSTRRVIKLVTIDDPFGTRSINNGRSMTFAFSVDTGKYIMRLGQIFHLIKEGETATRREHDFGAARQKPTTAEERARQIQEKRAKELEEKRKASKIRREQPIDLLDEDEAAPVQGGGVTSVPAGEQQAKEAKSGELGDLAAQRSTPQEGAGGVDTAAAEAKAPPKPARDPFRPVRKLIRFLGSMEPVNANIAMNHRSYYQRIYDRADLWYQLGLTDKSGAPSSTDSIADNIPMRATNNLSVDLSSSIGLTANIGLEVKAEYQMTENYLRGKQTNTDRYTWPALTLDWKGIEKRWLFRRYIRQSNLTVSFQRKRAESQISEENSYSLSPMWNLEWKNRLSSNVSFAYSKTTQKKINRELWDEDWVATLGLKYDIKGSNGIGIPLPFLSKKKLSFSSVLTTALNLRYSRSSTQIDPATSVLSASPTVSYRFSNNVTGGISMSYQRSSGGRLGRVYNTASMSMTAEFKF